MDNSVDIKIISCGNCGDKNLLKINGKQKEGGVMSFFENTRKPVGLGGKIMVTRMS